MLVLIDAQRVTYLRFVSWKCKTKFKLIRARIISVDELLLVETKQDDLFLRLCLGLTRLDRPLGVWLVWSSKAAKYIVA